MNKECGNCIKFKTQYCPCSIDCMAMDDKPFYQDKRMLLDENTNLKQTLNEIRELIEKRATDENGDIGINLYASDSYDILQIIDKVGGNEE